jgi:DNA adenine methylase
MSPTVIAPPFPYFGGKQRVASQIVAMFPEHLHYVEPFCGGLSVLLAKAPSPMETVNDIDGDLMTFWRVLRDQPEALARACALTPHSRGEHQAAFNREALDEVERARRVFVLLTQGRAGQLVRTGWRNYVNASSSPSYGMPEYLTAYVERLALAAERLQHVSLECQPAIDVIGRYGDASSSLLYVDPPYLGDTRGHAYSYKHEMRHEGQHRELSEALHGAAAAVVLSGYSSPLYDDLYADWYQVQFSSYTNQGNHAPTPRGHSRTETLWSNRPLNQALVLDLEGGGRPREH